MRLLSLPGVLWLALVRADWTPPELRHVPSLRTIGLRGDDGRSSSASLGVIVAEEWGANPLSSRDGGTFVEVIGNNRAFLASESRGLASQWVEDLEALRNSLDVLEEHLPAAAYGAIAKAMRAEARAERRAARGRR